MPCSGCSRPVTLTLVTSDVTKKEIEAIPAPARNPHEAIYSLLRDVPTVPTVQAGSLRVMVVGRSGRRHGGGVFLGGCRKYWEEPKFTELRGLLPDESDAHHVFQAISAGATHFVTTDERTILRHAAELARWIAAVLASELVARLQARALIPVGRRVGKNPAVPSGG